MKKRIFLKESELITIIKQIINETVLKIDPFQLSATEKGNIKINNGEKTHVYKMEVEKGIFWLDCTVLDFPYGKKIELNVAGMRKVANLDLDNIKKQLQSKFGQNTIELSVKDENKEDRNVKFTKIY